MPTLADVFVAQKVIRPYLKPTPLLDSELLSDRFGCRVLIKCENLNPTGAFKVRGGINLLSRLDPEQRVLGVVAASTGNHGQSIAYAARLFGIQATIYVPSQCNPMKVASMKRLGARVISEGDGFDEAFRAAERFATDSGAHFVHSANEPDLIAGVGTYVLEILQDEPEIDALFVPIGAGSGACGACVAGKGIRPQLQVIGVQAEGAPSVYDSWQARTLGEIAVADTFAEGIATRRAFELPAAILWDTVDDIMLVSDAELRRSIVTLLEATHMVAEGAGAAALAGGWKRRNDFAGKTIAVVLSGGNLTSDALVQALTEERFL